MITIETAERETAGGPAGHGVGVVGLGPPAASMVPLVSGRRWPRARPADGAGGPSDPVPIGRSGGPRERWWWMVWPLVLAGLWLVGFVVGLGAFARERPEVSGASVATSARDGNPSAVVAGAFGSTGSTSPAPTTDPAHGGGGQAASAGGPAIAYGPPTLAGTPASPRAAPETTATSEPPSPTTTPPSAAVATTTIMRSTVATVTDAGGSGPVGQEVLGLVNAEREAAGCGALTLDDRLTAAASAHSADMAARGYFSHTGLDGSLPWDRARIAGYPGPVIGENIAAGHQSPQAVMKGWMSSPGHRANILNCGYEDLGVGFSTQGNLWTQLFGAE